MQMSSLLFSFIRHTQRPRNSCIKVGYKARCIEATQAEGVRDAEDDLDCIRPPTFILPTKILQKIFT